MQKNKISKFLKNKKLLITGGTGSFGKTVLNKFLKTNVKEIIIFSRDERKQEDLRNRIQNNKVKFILGDVRNFDSLDNAMKGIDYVFHAAALKQVPSCEFHPWEAYRTNIIGTENTINAAIKNNIKKFILLSTDKAVYPINTMGMTKAIAEKILLAKAGTVKKKSTILCITRYGNVMGSRGSIMPNFIKAAPSGKLSITDKSMTRFNITLEQSVEMVLFSIQNSFGSEILVPKIPSYRITDLAKSISLSGKLNIIGVRAGEKIHEEMITESDSITTFDIGDYYIVLPNKNKKILNHYSKKFNLKKVKKGFRYSSGLNPSFLKIDQIRKLIKKHVDKNFKPI